MNPLPNLDIRKMVIAALIVAAFGIFILALPLIIPILGTLIAIGVIAAAVYGILRFLSGR